MNNWREIWIIGELCKEKGIPFVTSFVCDEKGFLLSGENYLDLQAFVERCSPMAISINCSTLYTTIQALDRLSKLTGVPLGAYPNIEDRSDPHCCDKDGGYIRTNISTQQFLEFMFESSSRYGLSLLGGCCGSTPNYIRALRSLVDSGRL